MTPSHNFTKEGNGQKFDSEIRTPKYLSQLIEEINNRLLKCLGYKTPQEIFQQSIGK